jgi:hypothetical protein
VRYSRADSKVPNTALRAVSLYIPTQTHHPLRALATDSLKESVSLHLGKKKKKPPKYPHNRTPIYNLFHWVSTVFPNALGNTVDTQCIILMYKKISLSFTRLCLSLRLSLALFLSLSPNG